LLGGVSIITGEGMLRGDAKPFKFTAIPYYAWDNRASGQMVVWMPEKPALAEVK